MALYDWSFTPIERGVGIVLTKEANEAMAMSLKLVEPLICLYTNQQKERLSVESGNLL